MKRFEFGVVAVVLGLLFTALLQRIWFYQGQAELAAVQQVAGNIRSALAIRVVEARLSRQPLDLDQLAARNPLLLLNTMPHNYGGEFYAPRATQVTPGQWYFDREDKNLCYMLKNGNSFGSQSAKLLKFKVKLFRLPKSPAEPSDASNDTGVVFEQLKDER